MEYNRFTKQIIKYRPQGLRDFGWPRKHWLECKRRGAGNRNRLGVEKKRKQIIVFAT